VPPNAVGNHRKVLVSDQGGRSNLLAELERDRGSSTTGTIRG
jgi:2-isopropylmalate synthase